MCIQIKTIPSATTIEKAWSVHRYGGFAGTIMKCRPANKLPKFEVYSVREDRDTPRLAAIFYPLEPGLLLFESELAFRDHLDSQRTVIDGEYVPSLIGDLREAVEFFEA